MSDLEIKPILKFFRETISSTKFTKNTKSIIISLQVFNNYPYILTLILWFLGYCETKPTISPTLEIAYRISNLLKLLVIRQSTIPIEELSVSNKKSDKNET